MRERIDLADAEGIQKTIFSLSPVANGWKAVADRVVDELLTLLRNESMYASEAAAYVLTISGYYTLSQYGVDAGDIPQELLEQLQIPKYPRLPATLIGCLARHIDLRGHAVGEVLLMDALRKALEATRTVASVVVVVEAKDENAVKVYKRYGFIAMPDHPDRLFIPMATVRQLFSEE